MIFIHPYYTGRDKGALVEFWTAENPAPEGWPWGNCFIPTFQSVEDARAYLRARGRDEGSIARNYRFERVVNDFMCIAQ